MHRGPDIFALANDYRIFALRNCLYVISSTQDLVALGLRTPVSLHFLIVGGAIMAYLATFYHVHTPRVWQRSSLLARWCHWLLLPNVWIRVRYTPPDHTMDSDALRRPWSNDPETSTREHQNKGRRATKFRPSHPRVAVHLRRRIGFRVRLYRFARKPPSRPISCQARPRPSTGRANSTTCRAGSAGSLPAKSSRSPGVRAASRRGSSRCSPSLRRRGC